MASAEEESKPQTPEQPARLELFEYVPSTALVVVAHPDDCDFLAASLLSAWVRQGCWGVICLATDGDAGSDDPTIPAGELSRLRLLEQRRAAAHLGVSEVICLGHPDGILQNTLELRRDLVRVLRQVRPEALVTMDPTRRWMGRGYLNHPDHRAAAEAALDAVFPSARDARAFPELLRDEGLEPHKTRFVFLGGGAAQDVAVPITDQDIENKLAALGEHHSQFDAAPMRDGAWDQARRGGRTAGVELADTYQLFDLVPNPSQRGYLRAVEEAKADSSPEGIPAPKDPATHWG